jgi:hypothetical protein
MTMKNVDILKDLNIRGNWLIIDVLYRKIKYFGYIKHHSGMERTIMEGMVAGIGRPRRMWIQDVKETLNMSVDKLGDLVRDRESFRRDVKRATFYKGQAS